MKAAVVVPSIGIESAGPSYTVPSLCRSLRDAGAEIVLYALEGTASRDWGIPIRQFKRHGISILRRLGYSPDMFSALKAIAGKVDVIHVNGIWLLPAVYPAFAAKNMRARIVYCPRGGLSAVALRRGRLKKWFMWHIGGQWKALKAASMFHAASYKEYEEIRALGLTQPVAVIPNGIDVPGLRHSPFSQKKRKLVFFGRIHETKAVGHLVLAWSRVAPHFPEWSLEIAGPDCGALSGIKKVVNERNIPRVSYMGELLGENKYRFLSSADVYVLPSLTENFGITIAEALACGTPVVASKGCPWPQLEMKKCGWWVDVGVDSLAKQLESVLRLPPNTLAEMGENGRKWMADDYMWESVGRKMLRACEWLVHGGEKPEFVMR